MYQRVPQNPTMLNHHVSLYPGLTIILSLQIFQIGIVVFSPVSTESPLIGGRNANIVVGPAVVWSWDHLIQSPKIVNRRVLTRSRTLIVQVIRMKRRKECGQLKNLKRFSVLWDPNSLPLIFLGAWYFWVGVISHVSPPNMWQPIHNLLSLQLQLKALHKATTSLLAQMEKYISKIYLRTH